MSPKRSITEYERFEGIEDATRRMLRQEELILEVTEAIALILETDGVSKAQLAKRMGKSPAFVSQVLSGRRNLTLRTIADICDALGSKGQFKAVADFASMREQVFPTSYAWKSGFGGNAKPMLVDWESTPDEDCVEK